VDDGAGRGFVEGIVGVVRCAVRAKMEVGEVVTWGRLRFLCWNLTRVSTGESLGAKSEADSTS
jgi:hypothetical protein